MKKTVNYVDAAKLETIVTKLGLTLQAQAGFIKVAGAKGRNVYIAKTKRVGRVDLSGFEMEEGEGYTNLGGESFGAVKQQLNFSLEEKDILRNFHACLKHMKKLPERVIEKKSMAPRASKKGDVKGWSPEALQARAALIAKVAAEKGVTVSPQANITIEIPAPSPPVDFAAEVQALQTSNDDSSSK